MAESLTAIGGVQLTIAGVSLAVLFDFTPVFWLIGVLAVVVGSAIVGLEIYRSS